MQLSGAPYGHNTYAAKLGAHDAATEAQRLLGHGSVFDTTHHAVTFVAENIKALIEQLLLVADVGTCSTDTQMSAHDMTPFVGAISDLRLC